MYNIRTVLHPHQCIYLTHEAWRSTTRKQKKILTLPRKDLNRSSSKIYSQIGYTIRLERLIPQFQTAHEYRNFINIQTCRRKSNYYLLPASSSHWIWPRDGGRKGWKQQHTLSFGWIKHLPYATVASQGCRQIFMHATGTQDNPAIASAQDTQHHGRILMWGREPALTSVYQFSLSKTSTPLSPRAIYSCRS
jgi:hypothetical protein